MLRVIILMIAIAVTLPRAAASQHIDINASRKDLERAARVDSNDAAAQYNVALAYWNDKQWEDAARELRLATTIDPQFAEAYLALAYLPYAQRPKLFDEVYDDDVPDEWKGAVQQSDRDYRRAFLLDPLCDLRIAGAVLPTTQTVISGEYEWLGDFVSGLGLLRQGKYEEAYERFQRVALAFKWDRHPERTPIGLRWYRGLAAAHAERFDAAVTDFRALLDSATAEEQSGAVIHVPLRTNDYRYVLATVEQRMGHVDTAIALFQEAAETDLGLYMAHVQLARLYASQHRRADALTEWQRAVDANPDDPSLLYDLGLAQAMSGALEQSLETLQRAGELNPRDARVPYYIGRVDELLHDTSAARAAYTRFLALAPSRFAPQIADAKRRLDALP